METGGIAAEFMGYDAGKAKVLARMRASVAVGPQPFRR
jgi:hypothetical protein